MELLLRTKPAIYDKARQCGISTALGARAAVRAAILGGRVLQYSSDEKNSVHLLEYARQFFATLHDAEAIPEPAIDQATRLAWDHGGEIRCFAANPSTARGYRAAEVHLDEFAHFTGEADLDREMYKAVTPSVSRGGLVLIVSTPYGVGNEYWRLWTDPGRPEDKVTIHYSQCPDLKVEVVATATGGRRYLVGPPGRQVEFEEESFKSEYCNDFTSSVANAFPWASLFDPRVLVDDMEAWG